MGRFHRHDDGTVHSHEHDHQEHDHSSHGHLHDHGHSHQATHNDVPGAGHDEYTELIGDHSGYQTGSERIEVLEAIFAENDLAADANRAKFAAAGVSALNLMSSPGAGKTALLAKTLAVLKGKVRVGIVEGDVETAIDADRLSGLAAQLSLLNTGDGFGGECHLDAVMVANAISRLDLDTLDLLLIENVGNLVCPAEFDVGAHRKAMVASVTEGEDKPLKYPVMFRVVDAVVVNKIDLLPHLDFDLGLFLANLKAVNPSAEVFLVSAKTGEGIGQWIDWLLAHPAEKTSTLGHSS
jgi:hydrogenase nickel incorporation protein HypB